MDVVGTLRISSSLAGTIVRHFAAALPNEGCGLLSGRPEGAALVAEQFFPGTNQLASPSRFAMEPAEVMTALTAIDLNGSRLIAIVHSHPVTGAVPSRTDPRDAFYPQALLLIVSFGEPEPRMRAWRVRGAGEPSGVEEVAIRVVSGT